MYHKSSIAAQIRENIESLTAVLVLANGTVPRVTVSTDYALPTLSTIFPKSLANNTAFMFTNVSSPLHWNFSGDMIPEVLKDASQFLLNSPIVLHKKYLGFKGVPNMNKVMSELLKAVKAGEQSVLEMLVDLFDWFDGLEPQSTAAIHQKVSKEARNPPVSSLTCLYLAWRSSLILAVNQEHPSNHTDNATLLQRIGKFLTRSVEKSRKSWKRR